MSINNDKLIRLAEILSLKYNLTAMDDRELSFIKNEIVQLYKKFILQYSGSKLAQLKKVYGFPYLDSIQSDFHDFVNSIFSLSAEETYDIGMEILHLINSVREQLNNFILTNKEDPAYVAFHMRKKVASTVDKNLEGFQFQLKRQLNRIILKDQKSIIDVIPSDRRRMEQTPQQQQIFVLTYGDLYGIEGGMEDWSKIKYQDPDLARDLMTAFLGLRRGSNKINPDLFNRVKKFFGERS